MGPAGTPGADARWTSFRDILFDYDKSDIRAGETTKIQEIVTFTKANPNFQVNLEGYADPRGTDKYNLALSDRRVKTTRDALVAGGVPADKVKIGALGEQNRNCTENTEDCFQRNRRVEVFVRPGS